MEHIAIMKKAWGLTEKILSGEKTAESRWYKKKRVPWNRIKPGDIIYFKDSGEPVKIKARVTKVRQFDNLNSVKTKEILAKYGADLGAKDIMPEIKRYALNKNCCILVFFDNVKRVEPFDINKAGLGSMSAWITINSVGKIKKQKVEFR